MTGGETRIRATVADNYRLLLASCIVASVLVGVVAVGVVGSDTRRVTDERTLYQPTASVTHGADVVTETPVYDRDRLEDRPVYFANVSPVISGTVSVGHRGEATLNTTVETAVVLRAVGESDGGPDQPGEAADPTVYWQRTFARNATSATLAGGEQVTVPYAVNATALFARVERIQRALDSSAGQTQVFLRATVHRRGRVAGRTVDRTEHLRVEFTGDGSAVRVQPSGLDTAPVTVAERHTVTTRPSGPLVAATVVGTGAVWLVTLALAAVGAVARYRDVPIAPAEAERARARFERERDEFAEWITAGAVPASVRERDSVTVDSLTGLVDVAIDTDSRVIESTDDGRFYVPEGQLCYVYDPPAEPAGGDDVLATGETAAGGGDGSTFEFPDSEGTLLPDDGIWGDDGTGDGGSDPVSGDDAVAPGDEPAVPEDDD